MPIASYTLATGARQLVVQEALEMMLCDSGSYSSKLTPRANVMSGLPLKRGDDDLLGARVQVLGGVLALGEQPGGLNHDVGPDVAPRQLRGVLLGEDLELVAVDDQPVLARPRPRPLVGAEDGVVPEQVGEHLVVDQVVDPDEVDFGARRLRGAEQVVADAPEAVDADLTAIGVILLAVGLVGVTLKLAGAGLLRCWR